MKRPFHDGLRRAQLQGNAISSPGTQKARTRLAPDGGGEHGLAEDALRTAIQLNHQIISGAKEGIIVRSRGLKILSWNPFMEQLTGVSAAEVIGKDPLEVFPYLRGAGIVEHLKRVLAEGTRQLMEFQFYVPQTGRSVWLSYTTSPLRDGQGEITSVTSIVNDITERKRVEERIAQLVRAQAILAGIDRAIVHIPDRQKLLDEVCRVAVEKGGFKLAWVGMVAPDGSVQPVAQAGTTGYLDGIRVLTADEPEGRGPSGTAIRENRPVVAEEADRDPRLIPWRERLRRFGLRYLAAFPIQIAGKVAGSLQVYAPQAHFFDADEVGLLTQVSDDISFALTAIAGLAARQQAEERIAQLNRAQAVMAGIARAIVHIPDAQKLMDEVCRVAVETGGFKLAWVGMVAPDGVVQPVAKAGVIEYLNSGRVVTQDVPEGRGPTGRAIRENRPVVVEEADRDPLMAPWHEHLRKFGMRYIAAFPIRIAAKVAGSFQVYAPRSHFFDENEVGLLTQVSDDISFALTAISDLAARKQAEAALRRSEHNLASFFNQSPIGLVWLSASGAILRANQAQLDLLGFAAEDYVGHSFTEFCEEPSQGRELLERLAAQKMVRNFRMARRCKDGAIRHVLVDAVTFQADAASVWSDQQFHCSALFVRDITDRVKLEGEVLQASEQESQRIARDLHDGLGQLLAAAMHLTSTLRKDLAAKSLPEVRQLGRIQDVLSRSIVHTRDLARGLHPVEPEPNGLMAALQALAAQTEKLFHVACHFNRRQAVLIKDNTVATHLFRIAQEAVTNAIKHGKPKRIQISLTSAPERLTLAVKDDGAGVPAPQRKSSGMGFRIMRYRAGMIGGSLAIRKKAPGGTAIVCTVHLSGKGLQKRPRKPPGK